MNYQDPNQQNQYQDPNQQYQQPQYQQPQYQQQPMYQQPMYQAPQAPVAPAAPVVKQPCVIGLVFSIIGLVFGILGILHGVFAWSCNACAAVTCVDMIGEVEIGIILAGFIPIITNVIGMVFSILGRKKMAATGNSTAMGTVGMILSIIGLVFACIWFLACSVVGAFAGDLEDAFKF